MYSRIINKDLEERSYNNPWHIHPSNLEGVLFLILKNGCHLPLFIDVIAYIAAGHIDSVKYAIKAGTIEKLCPSSTVDDESNDAMVRVITNIVLSDAYVGSEFDMRHSDWCKNAMDGMLRRIIVVMTMSENDASIEAADRNHNIDLANLGFIESRVSAIETILHTLHPNAEKCH